MIGSARNGDLWWTLWSAVFAVGWMLPTRTLPWTSFYSEAAVAFALLLAGVWCLALQRAGATGVARWSSPWFPEVWVFLGIGAVLAIQAAFGLLVIPEEVFLAIPVVASMGLMFLLAGRSETLCPDVLMSRLFLGLLTASFVSVGIAIYQWAGVDAYSLLVPGSVSGTRSQGNLGQPNNLATLVCWGMVATWWFHARGRISGRAALILIAYLLAGLVLTRSRTGLVCAAWMVLVWFAGRGAFHRNVPVLAVVAALGWLAFAWVAAAAVPADWVASQATGEVRQITEAGTRPRIYAFALQAILERPLTGYGWGQLLVAQVDLAEQFPARGEIPSYAHNVGLDLLVWFGIPLGALLILAVAVWSIAMVVRAKTAEQWLLICGLGVFGIHASLELPHAYAFFFLPAAAMAATLSAKSTTHARRWLPFWLLPVFALGMALALAALVRDYRLIEEELVSWRLYEEKIGLGGPPPAPDLWLLSAVPKANAEMRRSPSANVSAAEREHWRNVLRRYPALGGLARYARAAALAGDQEGARWALSVACLLHPPPSCQRVLEEHQQFEATLPVASN